jgi:hypothetical protein
MAPYDDTVAFDHYQQLQRRSRSAQSTTVSVSGAALSSSSSAQSATRAKTTTTPAIPWPYCDAGPSSLLANPKRWFGFLYSDVSEREVDDYSSVISRSNDLNNVLLTYVYHHPFCVPALLQVSSAMLEVAQQHRADNHYYATSFLRRALYVLETSALPSFSRRILACSAASSSSSSESGDAALSPGPLSLSPSIPPPPHPLMDYDRKEDRPWFDALQALVRIGTLTECVLSAWFTLFCLGRGVLALVCHFANLNFHRVFFLLLSLPAFPAPVLRLVDSYCRSIRSGIPHMHYYDWITCAWPANGRRRTSGSSGSFAPTPIPAALEKPAAAAAAAAGAALTMTKPARIVVARVDKAKTSAPN